MAGINAALFTAALDVFRGGLAATRLYGEKKDWTLPAPEDIAAMSQDQRDLMILVGIQTIGMRQVENEAMSSLGNAVRDLTEFLKSGGLLEAPSGGMGGAPLAGACGPKAGVRIQSADGKYQIIDPAGWPPGTIGTFDPATGTRSAVGNFGIGGPGSIKNWNGAIVADPGPWTF